MKLRNNKKLTRDVVSLEKEIELLKESIDLLVKIYHNIILKVKQLETKLEKENARAAD